MCPTSAAFFDRYVTHRGQTGSDNWIAEDIFRIVVEGVRADETKPREVQKIQNKALYLKPENISVMIWQIGELINNEKMKLSMPMIMLHAQSFRILKYVRDLGEPLVSRYLGPPDRPQTDLDIPLIAAWILQTYSSVTAGKAIMELAAGVFKKSLLKDGTRSQRFTEYLVKMGWVIPDPTEPEEEAEDEEPAGPMDPMRMPVDIGRVHESFGMPLDTSRLNTGVYIDTSGLRGDAAKRFRTEERTETIGADGDDPFEVKTTFLRF